MGQLPHDCALIEFKMYNRVDFQTGKLGELRFAAYLLTSDIEADQQIHFKDLGSVEELKKILASSEHDPQKIYMFLLGKFDLQIQNTRSLYIAPDGFLSLISSNWAAISGCFLKIFLVRSMNVSL